MSEEKELWRIHLTYLMPVSTIIGQCQQTTDWYAHVHLHSFDGLFFWKGGFNSRQHAGSVYK